MGDFQMTGAMAIVLLVVGSLVVAACGVATFLRYRKYDDEEDQDDRTQNRGDRTVYETSTICITASGNKTITAEEVSQLSGTTNCAAQQNNTVQNTSNTKTSMVDKEYHNSSINSGRVVSGPRNSCNVSRGSLPISVSCDRNGLADVTGMPITLIPSHTSPTSILRGSTSPSVYGTKTLQQKTSLSATDQPVSGRVPQSYHRNPDIIPAPLISPGTVYNSYNSKGKYFRFTYIPT